IGSNLVEELLRRREVALVRVLDNFSTGYRRNLEPFEGDPRFDLINGDIRDIETCRRAMQGISHVSHQAALGSVPRSVKDPLTSNDVNITGTLNIFVAAHEAGVARVVYAASSSTYGDEVSLPKREDRIGKPLSPYAVTKYVNELYADVFSRLYDVEFIGLRYFNVFGPGQDPAGAYAAVIPLFMENVLSMRQPVIFGDGTQSRDFTFISNVVQANWIALTTQNEEAVNQVYNIGVGRQTSLNELFDIIRRLAGFAGEPLYAPARAGDVEHSLADISKAKRLLQYDPAITVEEGLRLAFDWYRARYRELAEH
ncbi:MAG TPA: SDR family oxidoreductase, partial [Chitinophagaceae bacterium]